MNVENSGFCNSSATYLCYAGYNSDALVTASYAVFTEDRKVPLAVVGYQFQHLKLFNEFVSITSKVKHVTHMQTLKHFDSLVSSSKIQTDYTLRKILHITTSVSIQTFLFRR